MATITILQAQNEPSPLLDEFLGHQTSHVIDEGTRQAAGNLMGGFEAPPPPPQWEEPAEEKSRTPSPPPPSPPKQEKVFARPPSPPRHYEEIPAVMPPKPKPAAAHATGGKSDGKWGAPPSWGAGALV